MHRIKNSRIETIQDIKNRFQKQPKWLLIEVHQRDPKTFVTRTGRLLAYSTLQAEILKEAMNYSGSLKIDRSTYRLPKNYAVAF